ncbi:MAG: 4'-phosphopantetheinyl transferase superfamily protein [Deinococcales bacterium]|nr:4'-phosphopantetheinyl transferase superfamily protein [Chitinophagaceae bacterium]
MPLFYQHTINATTKLAIWHIEEEEAFFLSSVPIQNSITHPHKRLQHLAGRYLLRFLFPNFPNEEILIASTKKPFLPDEQYHFSISHCGDFAAAIVSKNERVGIDIELVTEKVTKISHKFLNETEKNDIICQPLTENCVLTLFWSAKETVFKWWGYGAVNFKQHIHLTVDHFSNIGIMKSSFSKVNPAHNLTIQYQFFNNLCLTFTHAIYVT